MSWDFETEPEFQKELDWIDKFVREEVEPLDFVLESPYDVRDANRNKLVRPLQAEVRKRKLWACHLEPELGGQGYGQVKLALMNEILGRSRFAPTVFGCQAPDSGNAEILAQYGTPEQKARYLEPLLDNDIVSCFSMTEPQGGADPKVFTTHAELRWRQLGDQRREMVLLQRALCLVPGRDGGHGSRRAALQAAVDLHRADRRSGREHRAQRRRRPGGQRHPRLRALSGCPRAQRPSAGRARRRLRSRADAARRRADSSRDAHHRAGPQMRSTRCASARSRAPRRALLADKQMVQEKIADSWIDIEQFRLLVLRTAWRIDKYKDYLKVRKDIAAVKAAMPKVFHDVAARALQVHGSLGVTPEMPFAEQVMESFVMGLADGPTEVHKITLARQVLRDYKGTTGLFPTGHIPALRDAAIRKFADRIELEVAAQ